MEERRSKGWWERLRKQDYAQEAWVQVGFSTPMILTNVAYYFIPLVSVMFSGHLGDVNLAGATLATTWATVTGFSLMTGLSGALETLCGQAYGAKMYDKMGLYLQAAMVTAAVASSVVGVIWWFTEGLLVALGQERGVAKAAAVFMRPLIPGLLATGVLQCLIRFLQTQSAAVPLALCSVGPLFLHVPITYVVVHRMGLGLAGAAMAASFSLWMSFSMLFFYVQRCSKFQDTWHGFSAEAFRYVLGGLRLAGPSAFMTCLEYWAFDIAILLAGLMPDSDSKISVLSMCINTQSVCFFITAGFGAVVSTRVANELGAGNINKAKQAAKVTAILAGLLTSTLIIILILYHSIWARFFSSSPVVIKEFGGMVPFIAFAMVPDTVQGVLSGIARGCGWQYFGAVTNLIAFYVIGIPMAVFLGFVKKLYTKGLYLGLTYGLVFQAGALFIVVLRTRWESVMSADKKEFSHV